VKRVGLRAPLSSPDALIRCAALSVAGQLNARLYEDDELVLIHPEPHRCDTIGVRVDDVAATLQGADVDVCLHMGIDLVSVDTPVPTLVYSQSAQELVVANGHPADETRVLRSGPPRSGCRCPEATESSPGPSGWW
jgi:hypothetical protein